MNGLSGLLSGLSPALRRWAAIGAMVFGLGSVLALTVGRHRGVDLSAQRERTVNGVLLSGDTRAVSMAGLASQLKDEQDRTRREESELGDLRKQIAHTAQLLVQQMQRMVAESDEKTRVVTEHGLSELQDRVNELAAGAGLPVLPVQTERRRVSPPKSETPPAVVGVQSGAAAPKPAPVAVATPVPGAGTAATTVAFSAHPLDLSLGAGTAPPADLSSGSVFGGGMSPVPAGTPVASMRGPAGAAGAPAAGPYRYVTSGAMPEAQAKPLPPADAIPEYEIPVGAILTGTIITGLDAPTAQGSRRDPFPVLIRLKKEAILPNRYQADVRECFLLSAGFGDLSSERVYLRSEQISCILHDGSTFQSKIQGYVTDESGKNGVRGRVVSRQGAYIARAILVGVMQGIAQAFSQTGAPMVGYGGASNTSSLRVYGSNLQYGASMGVGDAFQMIAQFYLSQASDMFPVIEVSAGREVDVVLTAGVRLRLPV